MSTLPTARYQLKILTFALVWLWLGLLQAAPAQARVTFGVVPGGNNLVQSEAQARLLGEYLAGQLQQPVRVRIFKDNQVLHEWLSRFRQVDLAVLPQAYVRRQPAGEFFQLTQLPLPNHEISDPLVARQGLSAAFRHGLQQALLSLQQSPEGRQVLAGLAGGGQAVVPAASIAKASAPRSPDRKTFPVKVPATKAPVVKAPAVHAPVAAKPQPGSSLLRPVAARGSRGIAAATGGALTLGVVPDAAGSGLSEGEARALADCLQVRLGVPVAVRLFQNLTVLKDWLSRYRQIDLALLPAAYVDHQPAGEFFPLAELQPAGKATSDKLVMRQGFAPGLPRQVGGELADLSPEPQRDRCASPPPEPPPVPKLATATSSLPAPDPGPASAARPRPPAPARPQPAAPAPAKASPVKTVPVVAAAATTPPLKTASARPAAAATPPVSVVKPVVKSVVPTGPPVTLGLVPAWSALVGTPAQAHAFSRYLQDRLGREVAVRLFADEEELYSWLSRNRQLDMAILRLDSFRGKGGKVLHLAVYAEVGRPRPGSADLVVLQHRLENGILTRLQGALLGMADDPKGRALMADLGISGILPPGEPEASALATPAEAARPEVPRPLIPRPELSNAPEKSGAAPRLVAPAAPGPAVGSVTPVVVPKVAPAPPQGPAPQAPAASPPSVAPQLAETPPALQAVPVSAPAPPAVPESGKLPVVAAPSPSVKPQPPTPNLPAAAQHLPAPVAAAPPATTAPVAAPAPPAPPAISAVLPKPADAGASPASKPPAPVSPAREAPKAATPVAPGAPVATPMAPTPDSRRPAVVAKGPAATATPRAPAGRPLPGAPAAPKLPPAPPGPRPIDILREPPPQQKIYVVPFTTLMVPEPVAEGVFDEFVDLLNDASEKGGTEFIILKSGTDKVGHDWLASRTYVTGELFGYVEDSGCCSTEIRAKARIHLFRPGQAAPVLNFEYPVEEMFDHDRSTLEKERERIAHQIAEALSGEVLKTLRHH